MFYSSFSFYYQILSVFSVLWKSWGPNAGYIAGFLQAALNCLSTVLISYQDQLMARKHLRKPSHFLVAPQYVYLILKELKIFTAFQEMMVRKVPTSL